MDRRWSVIPSVIDTVTAEETAACLHTSRQNQVKCFAPVKKMVNDYVHANNGS